MSDIVEKVARAIDPDLFRDRDNFLQYCVRTGSSQAEAEEIVNLCHPAKQAIDRARAVIEAIRETDLVYPVLEARTEAEEVGGGRTFSGDSGNWLWLWQKSFDEAIGKP